MFTKGNLVRRISEEGDGKIMIVEEDSDSSGTTLCTEGFGIEGQEPFESTFDTNDLELVADSLEEKESQPMELNEPNRTTEEIQNDISKMFIQAVQYMESALDGENIELRICTEYRSGNNLDVTFEARVQFDSWISSNSLFKSAQIAVNRHLEDEGLNKLSLPMYK